jgi:hypothetical protein
VLAREAQQQPKQQAAEEKSGDRYSRTSHAFDYSRKPPRHAIAGPSAIHRGSGYPGS